MSNNSPRKPDRRRSRQAGGPQQTQGKAAAKAGKVRRPARQNRVRADRGASMVGQEFQVTVGPVAHGGHCVARVAEHSDRVVFVRHTLPGEQVRIRITEGSEGDKFWRGDAVEVLEASVDRVSAPCVVSGPGGCGGCDFQHVELGAQRELKARVVREQLSRLAGLDLPVTVEAVPGDVDGLRWRTRTRYVHNAAGERGLRAFRSHEVIPVTDCLISLPDADQASVRAAAVEGIRVESVTAAGRTHEFVREAEGFWQVHPGAATTLVETVLAMLAPQEGEAVLDLYSGVGLFAKFLSDRTGPESRVVAVEGDADAAKHAKGNLSGIRRAAAKAGAVDAVLASDLDEPFDLVVLDPPREGAKRKVVDAVADRAPRAIAYVACDPAALARDIALFAERGYEVKELRAFDLFPMTHHVECVALLEATR